MLLSLPQVAESPQSESQQFGCEILVTTTASQQHLRFLLVDDFLSMRRIVKSVLNELGYSNVMEAEDGAMALSMLQRMDFDFLITDWNMPGMPGLALLREVRADARLAKLPVLMLTAEAKREQIVDAAQSGVSGYLLKPFSVATLKEKIERISSSHLLPSPGPRQVSGNVDDCKTVIRGNND